MYQRRIASFNRAGKKTVEIAATSSHCEVGRRRRCAKLLCKFSQKSKRSLDEVGYLGFHSSWSYSASLSRNSSDRQCSPCTTARRPTRVRGSGATSSRATIVVRSLQHFGRYRKFTQNGRNEQRNKLRLVGNAKTRGRRPA